MTTINRSFGNEFVATNNPSIRTNTSYESSPLNVASTLETLGNSYLIAESLKIFVKFFDHEYVGRVAQVSYETIHAEKWYIFQHDSWVEIDPEQLWFWTTEWQGGEKEVDQEYEQGFAKHFDNIDDLIDSLLK